ncbi:zinc finger, PHD-type, DC1 [Artemisia annua]|uniref:Zinc finger, PHD-type, DC1 n=1 Tax=Artemisia annua TaxID=35608 RepID=A0A2U1LM67_ARTAN|nr:zinc finger, PHD-type, DC1 [Artemisia annua]
MSMRTSKPIKYPDVLHLPFPDQTSVLKHFYNGESGSRAFETNLTHPLHRHPLTLVGNDITKTPTSSKIKASSSHDSMKMVEVLCNACIRPITNMSFYKCTASDEGCNFVLHAWCTRLPTEVTIYLHYNYKKHTLKLLPQFPRDSLGLFYCDFCELACNGFVYSGIVKGYYFTTDVHCGTQPFYECSTCKFYLHPKCALLWPDTIRHKFDKHHPMTLRYFPVENYSGDYFCEVCEEEFNPNAAFYHCDQCVYSMHPACCVSTETFPFFLDRGVDQHDNVKFGDMFMVTSHPHAVSFCRGVESDGECSKCGVHLQDKFILKCSHCKFAIDRECVKKYDYSPKPIV